MKLLCLHSDFIEFEPVSRAVKQAEDAEKAKQRKEDCLVVFAAVEKSDEADWKQKAAGAVSEVEGIAGKIKTRSVVVYPFVHLTPTPAAPTAALMALKEFENLLREKGYDVLRAPFGWYKRFTVSCKGHPLAELSREVRVGQKEGRREEVVSGIKSTFFVLTPEGREIPLDLNDLSVLDKWPLLKKFVTSEHVKGQPSKEPPSIEAMKRLELVDYEAASDPGHFRFYPKGQLIYELLKDWAYQIAVENLGCLQIETPLMYDWSQPDIRAQVQSFHQRHYVVTVPDEKKELLLRFAGDFGLFCMMKTTGISYKQLPLRVYEFSKSFRYEKRGELAGLRRLRAFSMPDIHSFCTDLEQGWNEFTDLYRNYTDLANSTGIEYAVAIRIVEDFYAKYKDRLIELLRYQQKPALVEVLSKMKHYWTMKSEIQGIDAVDGNCQLCTVQLDVEGAERYGIMYVDEEGKKKGCIICHASIGSLERWIYSILEDALRKKVPLLPVWLSPTQVRLLPIADRHIGFCKELAKKMEQNNVRVDLDDSKESINKKVRNAELEWIPYYVVVGDKELESGVLPVKAREAGEIKQMAAEDIVKDIKSKTRGYPFRRASLPLLLSKRPIFVG